MFGALCRHWLGPAEGQLRLPPRFALLRLQPAGGGRHPRGAVLPRLPDGAARAGLAADEDAVLGAKVGWALLVSSALFALGHLLVIPNPQRLAVFFPALVFGWMRARTGSIAAGATFHALCNVVSDVLHTSYFG